MIPDPAEVDRRSSDTPLLLHASPQSARTPTRCIGAVALLFYIYAPGRPQVKTRRKPHHRFRVLSAFSQITFEYESFSLYLSLSLFLSIYFSIYLSISFSLPPYSHSHSLSRPARRSLCTPFARFDRVLLCNRLSIPVCVMPYTLDNVFDSINVLA